MAGLVTAFGRINGVVRKDVALLGSHPPQERRRTSRFPLDGNDVVSLPKPLQCSSFRFLGTDIGVGHSLAEVIDDKVPLACAVQDDERRRLHASSVHHRPGSGVLGLVR